MKKYLLLLVLICSGCASVRPLVVHEKLDYPSQKSVCDTTPKDPNLVYEHVYPATVAAKRIGLANTGAIPVPVDWMSQVVEMMKTPGWKPLMENAPEVGWSTAGIVSAVNGTWYGIVPGLVGIPFRSFSDVISKNYEMQEDIRKLDDIMLQMNVASNNQVEVVRAYLPAHATSVKVKDGTTEIEINGKGN
jgi:hypothetical protein